MAFHVCIWCADNDTMLVQNWSIKLANFRSLCVYLRDNVLKTPPSPPHPQFDAIIVAPEYYFSRAVTPDDAIIIEHDQADVIRRSLKATSIEFPRYLLIPGSIAFRVLRQPLGTQIDINNSTKVSKDLKKIEAGVIRKPSGGVSKKKHQLNIKTITKKKVDLYKKALLGCTKAVYVTKNEAYVYLNGDEVFKVNKSCSFHEVKDANNKSKTVGIAATHHFIPRSDRINQTKIGDDTFIFEICFDHENEIAVKETAVRQSNENFMFKSQAKDMTADYHILMSDQLETIGSSIACKRYFIHACTVASQSHVRTPQNRDVPPSKTGLSWLSCEIKVYENLI